MAGRLLNELDPVFSQPQSVAQLAWASVEGGTWIFTHDTANVFLTRTHFVKTSQLSPTIVVLCCAGWRYEVGAIKAKWGLGTNFFLHENGLKFSRKVGIFPKMVVSPKKVFTFFTRLLMQRFFEWALHTCPSAPSNLLLIKWREA